MLRRWVAGLGLGALLLAAGALGVAAFAPIRLDTRDELFEIPKGTFARRMAGDKVEILPDRIDLTLALNDVLAAYTAGQARKPAPPLSTRKLVKEWTTRPDFTSPLVSHLPRRPGVPTPKDVLGDHIGEPKRLTYTADQQKYFKALEKALPGRVRTISAIRSPASVGLRPTFTPAARNASILPWAVPLPPLVMAPAWPIFLPSGAVTPAM